MLRVFFCVPVSDISSWTSQNIDQLTILLVALYVGPASVINLSTYDDANRYLHQTQMHCTEGSIHSGGLTADYRLLDHGYM